MENPKERLLALKRSVAEAYVALMQSDPKDGPLDASALREAGAELADYASNHFGRVGELSEVCLLVSAETKNLHEASTFIAASDAMNKLSGLVVDMLQLDSE